MEKSSTDDVAHDRAGKVAYVSAVLFAFQLFAKLAVVLVFVVPTFEQIFKDFKVSLPPATQILLGFSRFFNATHGVLWIWLAPTLLSVLLSLWATRRSVVYLMIIVA